MKIFLVDIIGNHSGAYYYNNSFQEILESKFPYVEIISNYHSKHGKSRKLFLNYYEGNVFSRAWKLLISLIKFYAFVILNINNCFIFLTYGNSYEVLFFFSLCIARKTVVDIHDAVTLIDENPSKNKIQRLIAKFLFKRVADIVILHSARSEDFLNQVGYSGERLYVPHFSYNLTEHAERLHVSDEVKRLISGSKINILFFGFMRRSKGIDVLFETASLSMEIHSQEKLNFIIAGNDPDNLVTPLLKKYNMGILPVSVLLRFINDEELSYLFKNCDIVFLPYREISQSGVLEMAIHFRKPVITSTLPFFTEILNLFPSFGIRSHGENPAYYIKLFQYFIDNPAADDKRFYNESDLKRFAEYKNTDLFLAALEKSLNGNN